MMMDTRADTNVSGNNSRSTNNSYCNNSHNFEKKHPATVPKVIQNERDKFNNIYDMDKNVHDEFITWIGSNGGQFPKLYLKEYANGVRGVHTKQPISENEVIMRIPYKCCITVEMGKATSTGKIILENKIETRFDAPKHIFLMLYMMIDGEDDNSFFQPYYNILPESLSCMPIFWDQEEYKLLKGSYILTQIQMRKDAIREDYELICAIDPTFKRFSLEYFAWARMIVCSRNFGGIVNGVKTSSLVPMADMLNHLRPRETRWGFREHSKTFEISATSTFPELTLCQYSPTLTRIPYYNP